MVSGLAHSGPAEYATAVPVEMSGARHSDLLEMLPVIPKSTATTTSGFQVSIATTFTRVARQRSDFEGLFLVGAKRKGKLLVFPSFPCYHKLSRGI